MIRNSEELKQLSDAKKAQLFDELIDHLRECPFGWHDEKIVTHRSTTEKTIVEWLQKTQFILSAE